MSNNPEVRVPFSEHDLDLVYRFHTGEIDMPELQSRLEFWRPAVPDTLWEIRNLALTFLENSQKHYDESC